MKKYPVFYAIIALFVLLLFSTQGLCFAGAEEIKARMQERLPTIVQMKTDGIIGEDNKGYLAFVPGAAATMQDVVADEGTVAAIVPEQVIIAGSAFQPVTAISPNQKVVVGPAIELVVTSGAEQHVVTGTAVE